MKRGHAIIGLAIGVAVFVAALSAVGFWKYAHYRYQGLDLAIYTNVLYNLSHGNGWWSSIQGGSYFGDHVEPILLAIAPLFRLWPDARLLIILQALALGLTAIPIYLLLSSSRAESQRSREISGDRSEISPLHVDGLRQRRMRLWRRNDEGGRGKALALAALWLLNPLLWNAALFEFHALAFAPLFLLSAAYAYVRRRLGWFLLWILLALMVREDVALMVVMFGLVAVVDRWHGTTTISPLPPQWRGSERGWGWILASIVLGIVWFLIAMRIAGTHSASGGYKFSVYYGWLAHAGPLDVLRHLVSIGNIDMLLGLFLPFLFLPLLRPRWLLLALPPLLQLFLAAPGGSNIVVETHYALLFVPALALASIEAMQMFSPLPVGRESDLSPEALAKGERGMGQSRALQWIEHRFPLPRPFAIGLGISTCLAAAWALGPFPGIAGIVTSGASAEDRTRRAAYDELLAHIPPDTVVAASYAALPHVAARSSAHSLAYAYLGVTQYGFAPYVLSEELRYLVMDVRDAVAYAAQFPSVGWAAPYAISGPEHLQQLLAAGRFSVIGERNDVALLERGVEGFPLADRYIRAAAPPGAQLVVDVLRDVTVSVP